MKNYRSELIALFGDPVDGNPTGVMMEAAFADKALDYRYITMKDVKRSNWFVNRDAQLFYFFFSKDNVTRMIIIEVSDEMHTLIKRYAAQGTYQVN